MSIFYLLPRLHTKHRHLGVEKKGGALSKFNLVEAPVRARMKIEYESAPRGYSTTRAHSRISPSY
jgi:hypothetical protein